MRQATVRNHMLTGPRDLWLLLERSKGRRILVWLPIFG